MQSLNCNQFIFTVSRSGSNTENLSQYKNRTVFVQQNKIQLSAVRLPRLQIIYAAISEKLQPARIICWDIAVELGLYSSSRDNLTL